MYYSSYLDIMTRQEIVVKNDISEQEFDKINEATGALRTLFSCLDYYYLVFLNCEELKENLYRNLEEKTFFIHPNRLFANLLNSFYVWREFILNHGLVKQSKNLIDKNGNDSVLIIANRLRHKSVHTSPIVVEYTYDLLREKASFNIILQELFSEKELDGFKAREKEWILAHQKVEVCEFVDWFQESFINLNKTILGEIESEAQKYLNTLDSVSPQASLDRLNTSIKHCQSGAGLHLGMTYKTLYDKMELVKETLQ